MAQVCPLERALPLSFVALLYNQRRSRHKLLSTVWARATKRAPAKCTNYIGLHCVQGAKGQRPGWFCPGVVRARQGARRGRGRSSGIICVAGHGKLDCFPPLLPCAGLPNRATFGLSLPSLYCPCHVHDCPLFFWPPSLLFSRTLYIWSDTRVFATGCATQQEEGDISFQEGDLFRVLEHNGPDWLKVQRMGPANIVPVGLIAC